MPLIALNENVKNRCRVSAVPFYPPQIMVAFYLNTIHTFKSFDASNTQNPT